MATPLVLASVLRHGQRGWPWASIGIARQCLLHRLEESTGCSTKPSAASWRVQLRSFAALPPHQVLNMPALSPTMSQGNLVKWHVKEGEQVSAGSVFADIETDKATLAFENQDDGYVAKLLVQENTKDIAVGTPVLVLVEDKESVPAFAKYSGPDAAPAAPKEVSKTAAQAATAAAPAESKPAATASKSSLPPHTRLAMPSLSPTMERGNIVKWLVSEGATLKPGDVLAEIETDKATLGFENQDDGILARILKPSGAKDIPVGETVAIIVEEESQVAAFANYTEESAPAAPAKPTESSGAPSAASTDPPPSNVKASTKMGPAARMLLAESGLSADQVTPTGPQNIITKGDVLAAIKSGAKPGSGAASQTSSTPAAAQPSKPAPATGKADKPTTPPTPAPAPSPGSSYVDTPNSQVRKVIASRLLESKVTIPALYLAIDTQLDEVAKFRSMLLEQGIKVSVNDVVLKAIAGALAEVPEANTYWDTKTQESKPSGSVDVCVAVATERGLITPIVKGADKKTLQQISKNVRELAGKARDNKLKPEEFMGGSFTVSNLGMMGVSHFAAIINPPQAAILAIGGTQQRTMLVGGKPSATTFMTVTLSADHRVYDGELAHRLLQAFKARMESPSLMLM